VRRQKNISTKQGYCKLKRGQKLCPILLIKKKFYMKVKERLLQKLILPATNHPTLGTRKHPKSSLTFNLI
jgi:hypothetical protein